MTTATDEAFPELRNTTYELFIGALSVLSIVNLFLVLLLPAQPIAQVAAIVDLFLAGVFLIDFLYRLASAPSRGRYFVREFGFIDLLSCIPVPPFPILRLSRLVRSGRLLRRHGAADVALRFVRDRADSALLSLVFLIVLVVEFGSTLMLRAEGAAPDTRIRTAGDALWFTYVTITTVGFGDMVPITPQGRVIGFAIMTAGIALFVTLTAYLARAFLGDRRKALFAGPSDEVACSLEEIREIAAEMRISQEALTAKIAQLDRRLERLDAGLAPLAGPAREQ